MEMAKTMKQLFRDAAHRFMQKAVGYDILRYRPRNFYPLRRSRLICTAGITCVVDIGANVGQYGRELREAGYAGKMVSFEPLSSAFEALSRGAEGDNNWQCIRMALGSRGETATLNVAGNLVSSSILPMLRTHSTIAPDSVYVRTENVPMRSLDSLAPALFGSQDAIWLKLDVQGFERSVLEGAEQVLASAKAVEIELTLQPLYDGQASYLEMIEFLMLRGFSLVSIAPGFQDENSGRVLQFDAVFFRDSCNHSSNSEAVLGVPFAETTA